MIRTNCKQHIEFNYINEQIKETQQKVKSGRMRKPRTRDPNFVEEIPEEALNRSFPIR